MRKTTLKVLKALLEMPKESDRKVADHIDLSQPTVTRTRHKLVNQKTITFAAFPNLAQLGYKILAFTTLHEADEYVEMRDELLKENNVLFLAKEAKDLFVISAHKDIEDFRLFEAKYPATKSITLVTTLMRCLKPLDFTKLITS